jgi:hypothetical protein
MSAAKRFAFALLAAYPTLAAADRGRQVIDAMPELGTVDHGRAHVVVRGELAQAAGKQALAIADAVVSDVERRFARATIQPDAPVTLCLLADDRRYRAVAEAIDEHPPSMWGFYLPARRVALINWGQSVGNLRHELVHPLIGDDFPGIPEWLNEGIAALYGTARPTSHGFEFLVNYRLRDLQRAMRLGELPTIAELAQSTAAEMYGPHAAVYYAMARYVLLYVEHQGKLEELYAALRDARPADRAAILARYLDDRSFVAWAKRLRF